MSRRPLTGRQAALVAGHVKDAEVVADLYRTRLLDRDEKLSAAYYGLVLAATRWREGRGSKFRTYAGQAMLRQIRDDARALRRRPTRPLPARYDAPDPAPGPEAAAALRDDLGWLGSALATLDPRRRLVLARHAAGATYRDIGAALGRTERAVRWAHDSGLDRLRALHRGRDRVSPESRDG